MTIDDIDTDIRNGLTPNFGVTLTAKGNRRTLTSFMGFKRSDLNGTVVYVDAPYKVHGFSIQYRRYLTTAAKRERGEAV